MMGKQVHIRMALLKADVAEFGPVSFFQHFFSFFCKNLKTHLHAVLPVQACFPNITQNCVPLPLLWATII